MYSFFAVYKSHVAHYHENGHLIKYFEAPDEITCIALTNDGNKLAAAFYKNLIIWDIFTGRVVTTIQDLTDFISIAITPSDSILVSGGRDATIKVWNLQTGTLINTLIGHEFYVSSIASTESIIVSGFWDKTVRVWDLNSGKLLKTFETNSNVKSVRLTNDKKKIISASFFGKIQVWNIESGINTDTINIENTKIYFADIDSFQDKVVCACGYPNSVSVYNFKDKSLIRKLLGHTKPVNHIEISPNEEYILSSSLDNTVRQWNFKTGDLNLIVTGTFAIYSKKPNYYYEFTMRTSDNGSRADQTCSNQDELEFISNERLIRIATVFKSGRVIYYCYDVEYLYNAIKNNYIDPKSNGKYDDNEYTKIENRALPFLQIRVSVLNSQVQAIEPSDIPLSDTICYGDEAIDFITLEPINPKFFVRFIKK